MAEWVAAFISAIALGVSIYTYYSTKALRDADRDLETRKSEIDARIILSEIGGAPAEIKKGWTFNFARQGALESSMMKEKEALCATLDDSLSHFGSLLEIYDAEDASNSEDRSANIHNILRQLQSLQKSIDAEFALIKQNSITNKSGGADPRE